LTVPFAVSDVKQGYVVIITHTLTAAANSWVVMLPHTPLQDELKESDEGSAETTHA
jgi:hypothetical protein